MEKHSWAPLVVSGALPRELTDLLSITILMLVGLQSYLAPVNLGGFKLGPALLLLVAPATCTLASLSNTARRLRGELALLAYGGSLRQIWAGHFLRGFASSLFALSPFIGAEVRGPWPFLNVTSSVLLAASVLGGLFYSVPGLRRVRSVRFAGHYKA